MITKFQDPFKQIFWPSFTDLVIGIFAILVFTLIISIIQQTGQARQIEMQEDKISEITRQNANLAEELRDSIKAGLISIKDGHIDITASILFPTGSSNINPDGKKLLKDLVAPLQNFISDSTDILMISGFTDDVAIRNPKFPSNWELSTARATEVVKQLTTYGFPSARIFAAGFGKFHPIVDNVDDVSRKRNRRVEISRISIEFPHHMESVSMEPNSE